VDISLKETHCDGKRTPPSRLKGPTVTEKGIHFHGNNSVEQVTSEVHKVAFEALNQDKALKRFVLVCK